MQAYTGFLWVLEVVRERIVWGIKHVLMGIIYGGIIYLLYGLLLPYALKSSGLPIETPERFSFRSFFLGFLAFFIAIESVAAALKGTVFGFIFRILSKLMGLFLFLYIAGSGTLSGDYTVGQLTYSVSIDISPIIAAVALLTFPFMILDVFGFVRARGNS